jgi:hypothetical protein
VWFPTKLELEEEIPMSNINIENLSYDMNMDREAMDTISGSGWFRSLLKKAIGYGKRNPGKVVKYARKAYSIIRRWF